MTMAATMKSGNLTVYLFQNESVTTPSGLWKSSF